MVLRKSSSAVTGNDEKDKTVQPLPISSLSIPMLSIGLFGTILLVKVILSSEVDAAPNQTSAGAVIEIQPTPIARAVNGSLTTTPDVFEVSTSGIDGLLLAQSSVQTSVSTGGTASKNEFLLARTRELMALDNRTVDDVAARLKAIIEARYESDTLNIETMATVDELRRRLAEFEQLLLSANSQKDALNADKNALEDRLNLILSERDNAQNELNTLAGQLESQLGSVQALKSETDSTGELLAARERELADLQEQYSQLALKNENAKNEAAEVRQLLGGRESTLADLTDNIGVLATEKAEAEQRASVVAAQLTEREQQVDDLAAELNRISEDRAQLVVSNENAQAEAAELKQLLGGKENALANLTAQFEAVSADQAMAVSQGSEMQGLIKQKEDALMDLSSQVNMLASERDTARSEVATVGELLNEKSEQVKELTLKLDELTNEKNVADDELALMQSRFEEVDSMASNFRQERDNLSGSLSLFEEKASDYNSAFLSEQQEHENTRAAVAVLEKDVNELQTQLNHLTGERDGLFSEKQHLEAISEDLNGRLLAFQKEMDTRQNELQTALTSIANLNDQIAELVSERDSGKVAIDDLQQEIASLQSELTRTQEETEKQMLSATTDFSNQRQALENTLSTRDQGIEELNQRLASIKLEKDEGETFFTTKVSEQDDMIVELKTRIAELESNRQELTGLQSQGEKELSKMQSQIAGLIAKRDMSAERRAKLKEANGKLTDQLKLTSEKLETVTADGAAQLGILRDKIAVLETSGTTANDEIMKLDLLNSELEAELNETRQNLEFVRAEGSDQVLALQAEIEKMEIRADDLAARELMANEKVSGLENVNQGLVEQLEGAQSENRENQAELDKLSYNLSKYEADLNIVNRQLDDLHAAQQLAEAERDAVVAEAEKLRLSLTDELNDAKLENITVQKTRADNSIPIRLGNADFFAPGSARLTRKGGENLTKLAEIIQTYDNRRIVVEGHTDNVPIGVGLKHRYESNWELSVARAAAAVRHMQYQTKIDPRNLSAAGFGEFQPVAGNDTDEERQKNRRVEVVLYPTNEEFKDNINFTGIDE